MAKPLHERLRGLLPDKVREKIPEKWQPPAWRAPVYAPSPWAGEDLEWNPGDPAEVPLGAYALGDAKGREIEHYIPPGTKGKVVAVAEGFVVFSDGQAGYQLLKSDVRSLVPKKERKWAAGEFKVKRLSDAALTALQIYIFDPAHADFGDEFPGRVEGRTLYVTDPERAWELLSHASNSADDDKDAASRNALYTLAGKVLRGKKADLLPGGQGDDLDDSVFDEVELELGIEDELEHTSDPAVAKEIAKDHLVGDPSYYSKMSAPSRGPFKITTEEERDTIRVLTWGELGNKGNYLAWSVDFDGADLPGLDVYAASLFGRRLNRRDVFFLFDLSPPPLGDDASQTWAQRSENHRRWKEETVGPWLDEVNQVVQAAVETWLRVNTKHDAAVDMTAVPDPSYYSKMGQYESVVYHGSREPDIEALEGGMPPYAGGIGAGVYVAFDPEVAAFYGPYVYELRLHVPPGEILWLTPDTIDYSLGELLPNSILVGEQVLPFSFHIGDQKYSVVADEREALEAIAAREMRNALHEVGGEWEAFRERFEASSRWLDADDAYEYLADGFAEQGFDVETAEAKAHAMAEWYRGLETQVLANAEKQLGLAIDLSEIGGEAAAAGYRAVYLEGVRARSSVDSELLVFDPADLEMLGQTRTAAGLGAEQAIDELARGDKEAAERRRRGAIEVMASEDTGWDDAGQFSGHYDILDRVAPGATWGTGGCWILAAAIGGQLFMVKRADGVIDHIVAKVGADRYQDADGLHSASELEQAFGGKLIPLDEAEARRQGEIPYDANAVAELQQRLRRTASDDSPVRRLTAAGLPAVGGAAKEFAAEVKQEIDQVRGAEYELRPGLFPDKESIEKMLNDVSDVIMSGRGRVPLTSYLDLDLVRSEEARARLKRIGTFVVVDGRTNHGGWFSPSAQLIGINVSPHELTYNSSWQIWQRIKTTFEHEVRHAIDWAYNPDAFVAANPGEESTGAAPKTRRWWTRYLNQPTELMAWAGNIAAALAIRPSSWERLKWSLDDYKVWVEKEGSVRVLDLVKEENKKRLLQMILKAYDQANPPGRKGPNKWQIMKSDLLAKRKIPESFVASLLPFVYGAQKREGVASEPTWQEWVKNRSTDQIVMEAENNYAVYKILRALPKNTLDEYPPLAPMIDDWRQKHGLSYTMRPETADAWSAWERAS